MHIRYDHNTLIKFCKEKHIKSLAFFGSVLRSDFSEKSDVDVLIDFEEDYQPGYIGLANYEIELSKIFGGRKVDLNTQEMLSAHFRNNVLKNLDIKYTNE